MANKKQIAVSTVAVTSLLLAGTAPIATAVAEEETYEGVEQNQAQAGERASVYVQADAAEGTFEWNQTTITPNEVIRKVFRNAVHALCGTTIDFAEDNPLQWKLTVSGDVDKAFTASVDELAQEQAVRKVMTCSCGGNPSDGKAIITADVKGIPLTHLIGRAAAHSDVNTVTFISADGTEVAMPLAYVRGHHGVISYEINGEDLSASVGGNNQLWLAGTPANFFVRDIVEIRVTKEEVIPENPGEEKEHPNSPNVGLLSGTAL